MNEETQILKPNLESQFRNVSVRAWIVTMLVVTVCLNEFSKIILALATGNIELFKITEPLYSLVLIAAGYYFGQNKREEKTK